MKRARGIPPWLHWLFGLALLTIVVAVVWHRSEADAFFAVARRAEPWWVLAAVGLQAATYLAQGQVWREVVRASGFRLPLSEAFGLSLAKLFADQLVPSVGISGSVMLAGALERRSIPRAKAAAAVVIQTASYYAAYMIGVGLALAIAATRAGAARWLVPLSGAFLLVAGPLTIAAMALPGRAHGRHASRLMRFRPIRDAIEYLQDADPALVRSPSLMTRCVAWQLAVLVLDSGTLWTLLLALGTRASPAGVFISFVVASLVRTLGIVPGGLGTFDAACIAMLRLAGVDLATALAATLLLRGLSSWLPMIPGLWYSRRAALPSAPAKRRLQRV
jgi:Mg2+-importing ATPase